MIGVWTSDLALHRSRRYLSRFSLFSVVHQELIYMKSQLREVLLSHDANVYLPVFQKSLHDRTLGERDKKPSDVIIRWISIMIRAMKNAKEFTGSLQNVFWARLSRLHMTLLQGWEGTFEMQCHLLLNIKILVGKRHNVDRANNIINDNNSYGK